MDPKTVRFLWDYTKWADARAFDAVGKLAPEPYLKDLGSSMKSVRDTMVHIVSAQWIWASRWKGNSPKAMWKPEEFPTAAELRERHRALHEEIEAIVSRQTDQTLAQDVTYQNLKGDTLRFPLGALFLHVVNHSTYHRGQVTTLLRQLGAQPVSTDLAVFLASR
ncbi:MAG TPA: DinB family protein [Planctomycetota bacterium]|nr:DinB family protein [Planctomycetota bacterium]